MPPASLKLSELRRALKGRRVKAIIATRADDDERDAEPQVNALIA